METPISNTIPIAKLSEEEIRKLVYDLQVHQIELEMQNEELRKAQIEIEESRQKYLDLYDFAPVGYFTVDEKGIILNANLTCAKILGRERSLLIKTPLSKFITRVDQDKYYLYRQHGFQNKGHNICELKMIKEDGSTFYAQLKCAVAQDEDENSKRCRTVITDITERKQTEIELQEHRRQLDESNITLSRKNKELSVINKISNTLTHSLDFDETLENILSNILKELKAEAVGLYLIDKENNQLRLAGCKGFSKDEIKILRKNRIGIRFHNSVVKTNEPFIIKNVKSNKYLSRIMKVDDGTLSIVATPLISQENVIGTIFVTTRELHHSPEEDIRFFKMIGNQIGIAIDNCLLFKEVSNGIMEWEDTFNTISDSICIVDKNFRIVKVNRGTLRLVDMEMEDLLGKNSYEIFYGTDNPVDGCPILNCIQTNKVCYSEIYSTRINKILFVTAFPRVDENGKLIEIVQVVRDVTDQRAFEDQLKTSHKLASLGRLTAGVMHEILNPVNIISSHIQVLLMEAEEDSRIKDDLISMQEEIARITKITDNLLRFSRKEKVQAENIEINNILDRTISIVEPELKLLNIKIMRKPGIKLPCVTANSDELRQVFLNLIMNARDAMSKGGNLIISTQRLEKEGKPYIRIEFKDTGEGIREKDIKSVFDPFFTTKKEGQGTGLGLSESYNIIENHGGEMSVVSKVGEGSTFIIDIPAKI